MAAYSGQPLPQIRKKRNGQTMKDIIKQIEKLNVFDVCTNETAQQIKEIKNYLKDKDNIKELKEFYIYAAGYINGRQAK